MYVIVSDYQEEWPSIFLEEEKKIQSILGDTLTASYHIGSTSVPGLQAKPVIDILLVLERIEDIEPFYGELKTLGYSARGEHGIAGRRYFEKGGVNRTHQIHAFGKDSEDDIVRHLAFRDYLKAHPGVKECYGALKKGLATSYPEDIENYWQGKDPFIKDHEQKAVARYKSQK